MSKVKGPYVAAIVGALEDSEIIGMAKSVATYGFDRSLLIEDGDVAYVIAGGVPGSDPGEPDELKLDIIVFCSAEGLEKNDLRPRAIKSARIFANYDDPGLRDLTVEKSQKLLFYSEDDPWAHFYATDMKPSKDGFGITMNIQFQLTPSGKARKKSWFEPLMQRRSLTFPAEVHCGGEEQYIPDAVACFGIGSALGINPNIIPVGIGAYKIAKNDADDYADYEDIDDVEEYEEE